MALQTQQKDLYGVYATRQVDVASGIWRLAENAKT